MPKSWLSRGALSPDPKTRRASLLCAMLRLAVVGLFQHLHCWKKKKNILCQKRFINVIPNVLSRQGMTWTNSWDADKWWGNTHELDVSHPASSSVQYDFDRVPYINLIGNKREHNTLAAHFSCELAVSFIKQYMSEMNAIRELISNFFHVASSTYTHGAPWESGPVHECPILMKIWITQFLSKYGLHLWISLFC